MCDQHELLDLAHPHESSFCKIILQFPLALSLPRNEPNSVWLISTLQTLGDPAVPRPHCLLGLSADSPCHWVRSRGSGATGCGLSSASQTILLRQVWAFPQMLVKASQSLRDRVVTGQGSVPHLFLIPRTQQMDFG